jgi:hypothetical protein
MRIKHSDLTIRFRISIHSTGRRFGKAPEFPDPYAFPESKREFSESYVEIKVCSGEAALKGTCDVEVLKSSLRRRIAYEIATCV